MRALLLLALLCTSCCFTLAFDVLYVAVEARGIYNNVRGIIPALLDNGHTVTIVSNDRLISWVKDDFVNECYACDYLPRLKFESWGDVAFSNLTEEERAFLSSGELGPKSCEIVSAVVDKYQLHTTPFVLSKFANVCILFIYFKIAYSIENIQQHFDVIVGDMFAHSARTLADVHKVGDHNQIFFANRDYLETYSSDYTWLGSVLVWGTKCLHSLFGLFGGLSCWYITHHVHKTSNLI